MLEGKKRDVIAREIRDARNAAHAVSGNRKKYNECIKKMLIYGKKRRQIPRKKKRGNLRLIFYWKKKRY